MDFSRRSQASELMDTETVTPEDFARCLADLSVVNTLTMAKPPTLAWLTKATRGLPAGSTISILDVGFGHGDMLRAIWRWSQRRGLKVALHGIDLNPLSAAAAKQATPPHMNIGFQTGDIFAIDSARRYDFVISSLVTHHMSDMQIVAFLRWMEQHAARGWFVNDLHRHAVSYHAFRVLSALAGWHRFVRHDGPVSIARSFRRDDWQRLLQQAAVSGDIRWHMPFRYCVGHI
nr:methyltransferase domain-containing protein [uncultured Dongia sp.]